MTEAPFHVGWHRRPGGQWKKICEGPDHGTTMRTLLEADLPSGEMWVGEAGQHPNGEPIPEPEGTHP